MSHRNAPAFSTCVHMAVVCMLALSSAARTAPAPSAPLFGQVVSYAAGGQNSYSIAVGDVNGDGKPDLVIANDCASSNNCANGSVGVLLGNGDGTFQAAVSFNTGGFHASSVAVVDVNGDGLADIIVGECASSSSCDGTAAVLISNGNGTFQTAVPYFAGGYTASAVSVADVNGDGRPDLIVANQCANVDDCSNGVIGVLLGNGNGTFVAATTWNSGGQYADSLGVADINGDGKLDVVVAHECSSAGKCSNGVLGVLFGNGDGTFQAATAYSTGGQFSYSVFVADVNGDGKPDLLATNRCPSTGCLGDGSASVLLNKGNGTFRTAVAYDSGGPSPDSIAAADVNGDGKPDLIVANNCDGLTCTNGAVSVLQGNGDGTFQAATAYQSGGYAASSLVAKDVNGDGKADLVVANLCISFTDCSTGVAGVLLGVQAGTVTIATTSLSPSFINEAVTFTATITSGAGKIPNGEIVTFADGTTQIGTGLTNNGIATLTTSTLPLGTQFIKANYPGDSFFQPSSGAVQQIVTQYTTTTILASSPNPSLYGQSVQLLATVASSAPGGATGTVTFKKGNQVLGTGVVAAGKASFTVTNFPAGSFSLSATYNGDAQSGKSSGSATQVVNKANTSTSLTSSLNPSKVGQYVKFTATVTSTTTTPTGTVAFMDGTKTLATTYLTQGIATYSTNTLTSGTHGITAVYNGTPNIAGSKSSVLQQIVQ